jgi:hypothetical protein
MSKAREQVVAEIFFALGDRTRMSVVQKLGSSGALSATVLSDGAKVSAGSWSSQNRLPAEQRDRSATRPASARAEPAQFFRSDRKRRMRAMASSIVSSDAA